MLSQEQISEIIKIIVSGYKPEKIYLFGSYSSGNPNKDSDIDLLIIKNTTEPFIKRIRQVRHLFKIQPAPMDLLIYTPDEFNYNKSLVNNIINIVLKEGKLIYEQKLLRMD
jgi:uncharacterized protein